LLRIGVDLIEVARIERLLADHPNAGAEIFSERELAYANRSARPAERLAARFAVKEAVLKAFGTGLGQRMRWTEVEVINEPLGRPRVELHGEVARWAERRGVTGVEVSLSHAAGLAVAQAAVQLDG
jgi:holo-[acyl-carrier protein] synthase